MQLGKLKAAIRGAAKIKVVADVSIGGSPVMRLALEKTPLLASLDEAFPGGKTVETNMTFDADTGILSGPGSAPTTSAASVPATVPSVDLSDDLSADPADDILLDL